MAKPKSMAVTHADLAPKSKSPTRFGTKSGILLIVLAILCALFGFALCLVGEVSRLQVQWLSNSKGLPTGRVECSYNGDGRIALTSAGVSCLVLALAVIFQHLYLLVAFTDSPTLPDWQNNSDSLKSLFRQAGVFYVSSGVCFVTEEVLLLIGFVVESGHLKNWSRPRSSCLVIRRGVFSAAAVFCLVTVFLATGLYLTTLQMYRILQELENSRQQVIEASAMNSSARTVETSTEDPKRIDSVTILTGLSSYNKLS